MSVRIFCTQYADGKVDSRNEIPVSWEGYTPEMFFAQKAKSHAANGWTITHQGTRQFTAAKKRWGGCHCVRVFTLEGE